jgi:hypothetical protein
MRFLKSNHIVWKVLAKLKMEAVLWDYSGETGPSSSRRPDYERKYTRARKGPIIDDIVPQ